MQTNSIPSFGELLRARGLKATPKRLALMDLLRKVNRPISTTEIVFLMNKKSNQSTIYRGLDSLSDVGLIRRVDMQHAHTHYELSNENDHHHHIICKYCHQTEDVHVCILNNPEDTLLKKSKTFSKIQSHTLEYFGVCNKCFTKQTHKQHA